MVYSRNNWFAPPALDVASLCKKCKPTNKQAKHAVLNVVTRDNPPNLTNKDFTIEDWGRKISHQQEEGKEFQKQLQKYINALRTLTFERSRLLDLLLLGITNIKNLFFKLNTLSFQKKWESA